ncbi:hypothetical protein ACA29_13645 [Lederbergia galactosidilytica]|uniref:Uncharacterized protein n=1 Tax=Lederbergia galactosidilytica TaxID=217031 RepID=A0A0Q9Y2P5_9BACI|nr:hypothetical protein ACA29_13645 [Lederbergia galactosidilytica]
MDTFIHRFLLSILLVTLLIVTIVLLKRVLNKHLSVKAHYQIWFFLLVFSVHSPDKLLFFHGVFSLLFFHGVFSN